ncbi:MAG: hypothetical protein JJLCMIEE_01697 [Acidimicrobiales bacterium]|nr:hypothetical protein [Acidimicrobiales bacterium]
MAPSRATRRHRVKDRSRHHLTAEEQAADEDGVSFSSWLSAAAEDKLLLREGMLGIREWEAEAGELNRRGAGGRRSASRSAPG